MTITVKPDQLAKALGGQLAINLAAGGAILPGTNGASLNRGNMQRADTFFSKGHPLCQGAVEIKLEPVRRREVYLSHFWGNVPDGLHQIFKSHVRRTPLLNVENGIYDTAYLTLNHGKNKLVQNTDFAFRVGTQDSERITKDTRLIWPLVSSAGVYAMQWGDEKALKTLVSVMAQPALNIFAPNAHGQERATLQKKIENELMKSRENNESTIDFFIEPGKLLGVEMSGLVFHSFVKLFEFSENESAGVANISLASRIIDSDIVENQALPSVFQEVAKSFFGESPFIHYSGDKEFLSENEVVAMN